VAHLTQRRDRDDEHFEPRRQTLTTQRSSSDGELLERIHALRSLLPAMATEVALARREGARLRNENVMLRSRLAELERQELGVRAVLSP